MSLNISELDKLAKLARLELTAGEKKKYAEDISAILNYVSQLQAVKTAEQFTGETQANNLRVDRVVGIPTEEQQALIRQAPEQENNLIKTKPVF